MAKKKESTAPTAKQVETFARKLQDRCQKRNADIEYRRKLRWCELPVVFGDEAKGKAGIPSLYRRTTIERRSTLLQYQVQEAQALLNSNAPTTAIRIANSDNQAVATRAERWCNGGRARTEEATGGRRKVIDTQIAYYAGVRKCHPRKKYWDDYPERDEDESDEDYNKRTEAYKKGQSLLSCFEDTFVPPDTFFAAPRDSKGIPACCEIKKVNEADLMKEFGLETKNGDYLLTEAGVTVETDDPLRTCEVIEYWNRKYRVLVVKGKKTNTDFDVWEHGFGCVPYFEAAAFETGETAEELRYIPLLWPLYPEVEDNNRLHTMRENILNLTAFPKWYIANAANGQIVLDETTKEPKVYDLDGPPNQLGPGQTLVQVSLTSSFDFQAAVKDSDDRLRTYALPPVASGKAPSSESAGWNTAMLRRFMLSLLDPLVQGLANQEAAIDRFKLWCVKHIIKEKVYVNADVMEGRRKVGEEAIAIGPEDVDKLGDYDLVVRIDPNLQMDRIPQEKHGWELVVAGGRAMRTWLEQDCGNEAPEEEMFNIDVDKAVARLEETNQAKMQAWIDARGAVEGVLGGTSAESVVREDETSQTTIGKGSPGLPRTPGVLMPPAPPIGQSPTYTPPGVV
jgi:hypothetical protein